MVDQIQDCLQETERLRRKMTNCRELLCVRRDDLVEESHDFHTKLIQKVTLTKW